MFVDALESLLIPMEVSGAGAFGESKEVAELALLLRALSDPQDSVALVGVLRGALFGISDQQLFAHKQGERLVQHVQRRSNGRLADAGRRSAGLG